MKKKMFYSCLSMISLFSIAFCEENDSWDEYYYEKPLLIEWEGHIWQPYCLEHSDECPCHEDNEDLNMFY